MLTWGVQCAVLTAAKLALGANDLLLYVLDFIYHAPVRFCARALRIHNIIITIKRVVHLLCVHGLEDLGRNSIVIDIYVFRPWTARAFAHTPCIFNRCSGAVTIAVAISCMWIDMQALSSVSKNHAPYDIVMYQMISDARDDGASVSESAQTFWYQFSYHVTLFMWYVVEMIHHWYINFIIWTVLVHTNRYCKPSTVANRPHSAAAVLWRACR